VPLRRLLIFVCAVVLLDTAFYAVVAPLLPQLSAELGLTKAQAGVLTGAYAAGTLAGALPMGLLASRIGPRRVLLLGLGLLAGSSVTFGLVREIVVLDLARFAQGVGGACSWAGAMAWLLQTAPASRRGELIGTAVGSAIAGALLGPVLGAVASVAGQAVTFVCVAALAVGLGLFALRAVAPPRGEVQTLGDVRRALGSPLVRLAAWLVVLPALSASALSVLVPLRLAELGLIQLAIAGAFLVAAGAEAAVSPVVGRLSDRRGRLLPIAIGLAAAAVLLAVLPWPAVGWVVAAGFVLATMALGTFWAPAMAMLSDHAEATGLQQGPALGLVNLAWATGATVGAVGGGFTASQTSDAVPLLVLSGLCLLTLTVVRSSSKRSAGPLSRAIAGAPDAQRRIS
jgi:predicted MFS family arabinose efflux permease